MPQASEGFLTEQLGGRHRARGIPRRRFRYIDAPGSNQLVLSDHGVPIIDAARQTAGGRAVGTTASGAGHSRAVV